MAKGRIAKAESAGLGIEYLVNVDVEEALLGSILIDGEALGLVRPMLSDADFSSVYCASVYRAMLRVTDAGRAIDFVTLSDEVGERGGDTSRLIGLTTGAFTSVNALHYAHIIAELSARRRLMMAGAKIVELAADEERGLAAIKGDSFNLLAAVDNKAESMMVTSAEAASAYADDLQRRVNNPGKIWGLQTGIRLLDRLLGGIEDEYVVLAGRPSHGKSALALQIAYHVAKHGGGVAYFSPEMNIHSLQQRFVGMIAHIDSYALRSGQMELDEHVQALGALAEISELPIYWCDKDIQEVDKITAHVARLRLEHDIKLVVVDYLQLLHQPGAENRTQALGIISRAMKRLTEQGLSVLAVAQLSRAVEVREEHIPRLDDLRESGNIEQDADIVMFVNREELRYKQEGKEHEIPEDVLGRAQVIVAKRRNGDVGSIRPPLLFFDEWGLFAEDATERPKPKRDRWWDDK